MDVYPNNTLTSYTTSLPKLFDLQGEWVVGLVEIQYSRSWFNIPETSERTVMFMQTPETEDVVLRAVMANNYSKIKIEPGYYTPLLLRDRLNEKIKLELNVIDMQGIQVSYDTSNQVFTFDINGYDVFLSSDLQTLMGFEAGEYLLGSGVNRGFCTDMEPIHSLYVYCDLLESRVVGDIMAPLLRIVPVEGMHGETVTKAYENVHYIPLQRRMFETVEIDIRDNTGKKIPFERGTLNSILHFK